MKQEWKKTLRAWYRETRQQAVTKASFPSLLKILWSKLKSENVKSGFIGTGLYPLDDEKPLKRVINDRKGDDYVKKPSSECSTPKKALQEEILNVISPEMSQETAKAVKKCKIKRRRINNILCPSDHQCNRIVVDSIDTNADPKPTRFHHL
jgi:hypothetical protein